MATRDRIKSAQLQATGKGESKKSEVGELRSLLRSNEIQRDPHQYEQVVQKVIAYMTLGVDVSGLFSEMIMAGATQNMVQKKMVYLYLSTYAEQNSDLALLTVNTLQKDANDRNPVVRGLALRSMCSLRIPDMVEYIRQPLQSALQDRSSYVRKTAVMGVVKLFYLSPSLITELNLVDFLYQMLRDKDAQVVCNCISALDEILAKEGGMVVTRKIAHYLINRLRDFSEWGQCQVLQLMLRYKCANDDEMFDILNVLDDRLRHVNCGVVLGAIKLFFHLTEDMVDLQSDIYQRIKTPLLTLIGSASSELVYTCLQHIEVILYRQPHLYSQDYHNFFCRYNDPPYVKVKKLELLTQLCTESNAHSIVDEMGESATDVSTSVAQKAIKAIGIIALQLPSLANMCVDKLLSLLVMEIDHITSEVMVTMTNILRKYESTHESILPRLLSCNDVMTSPDGRAALFWIIGEYGESLPDSPYQLEEAIDHISEESSSEVKMQLLAAVMKLFFKRPPECQMMLGRLLEFVIEDETDMLVRDRGLLYYRLLKSSVQEAKRVVCGGHKIVSQFTSPPKALSLFNEFNTLSVMYMQPSTEFITQEAPYILIGETQKTEGHQLDEQIFSAETGSSGSNCSVGELLELMPNPLSSDGSKVPHMMLNPSPSITSAEFEQKWLALPVSLDETVQMSRLVSLSELQGRLSDRFIMTLASSPDNQPIMKMFLFAQHVSTLDYFFMEVVITAEQHSMRITVKTDNTKLIDNFKLHFFDSLSSYLV